MPRLSIAIISASALAYEVLLTKLFSIILWHHFAYMIISLALLGGIRTRRSDEAFFHRLYRQYHPFFPL